ncbi:MAG: PH domain-containing protein [Enhydrobacter sp.]|nr:PH domain-containing protein [Enhydrobacter sp.]
MAYVDSVLQPGEAVKVIGRLHWTIFIRSVLLATLSLLLMVYGDKAIMNSRVGEFIVYAGWIGLAVALVMFLSAAFKRWTTELSVTTHRVIYKRGFIWRHTVEMNMDKVETVNVDQSILGRILGYGTIHVLGTGQGGISGLRGMGSPITIRNAITAR